MSPFLAVLAAFGLTVLLVMIPVQYALGGSWVGFLLGLLPLVGVIGLFGYAAWQDRLKPWERAQRRAQR